MIKSYNVEIPKRVTLSSFMRDDIAAFAESNYKNAEIEVPKDTTATNLAAGYTSTIKRMGLSGTIKVMRRKERLFLTRIDTNESEGGETE